MEDIDRDYREGCRSYYYQTDQGAPRTKAEEIFSSLIKKEPAHHQSYNMLGMCFMTARENRKALEMFQSAIDIEPRGVYYLNKGIVLAQEQELQKAEEALEKAVELDGMDPSSRYNLGIVQHFSGKLDEAIYSWNEVLTMAPNYEDLHSRLALALAESGDTEEAVDVLLKGVGQFPHDTEMHINLSRLLENTERFGEAVELWETFLEKNSHKDETTLGKVREHLEIIRQTTTEETGV